jgi:hypothetical protein
MLVGIIVSYASAAEKMGLADRVTMHSKFFVSIFALLSPTFSVAKLT